MNHIGQTSSKLDQALLKTPIKDNGQGLVNLADIGGGSFDLPDSPAYLRQTVAEALSQAARDFAKQGFRLKLLSAYRPLAEQEAKFKRRFQAFKEQFPTKSASELLEMANTYTAGIPALAAHTGGAAVDVVLLGPGGKPLDFGVEYPQGGDKAITDYAKLPAAVKANRRLLKTGMERAGFTNYPYEYWHYSIGDVCAAHLNGQPHAIFGPVDFNPATGRLKPLGRQAAYKMFKVED